MKTEKILSVIVSILSFYVISAQTVVKMDMPKQADQALKVVALFEEEIPEGVPVVLGLMGYDIKGGSAPFLYEWLLNGTIISTDDIVIFTPKKGDKLALKVTDNNKCQSSTTFNLKMARVEPSPTETIKIYPTRVSQYVHIDVPIELESALVRIFDTTGKLVKHEKIEKSCDVTINLSEGTYFVSVKSGIHHKVEKIIVE